MAPGSGRKWRRRPLANDPPAEGRTRRSPRRTVLQDRRDLAWICWILRGQDAIRSTLKRRRRILREVINSPNDPALPGGGPYERDETAHRLRDLPAPRGQAQRRMQGISAQGTVGHALGMDLLHRGGDKGDPNSRRHQIYRRRHLGGLLHHDRREPGFSAARNDVVVDGGGEPPRVENERLIG